MARKNHRNDHVFNKVDGIMNHYKKKPVRSLVNRLRMLITHFPIF